MEKLMWNVARAEDMARSIVSIVVGMDSAIVVIVAAAASFDATVVVVQV
jgi:hypothetical protein